MGLLPISITVYNYIYLPGLFLDIHVPWVILFPFLFPFQLEIMTNIAGETSIGTILREFQVSRLIYECMLLHGEKIIFEP